MTPPRSATRLRALALSMLLVCAATAQAASESSALKGKAGPPSTNFTTRLVPKLSRSTPTTRKPLSAYRW